MDADSIAQIRAIVTESGDALRRSFLQDLAEVKRHNGVLIEDLRHKLDLVVEGQQDISRNVESVRSSLVQESEETRALVRLSYHQLQQRVESLEQRVQAIEQRIGLSI